MSRSTTFSKLKITRDQSSKWTQLADVPEEKFEEALNTGPMPSGTNIPARCRSPRRRRCGSPAASWKQLSRDVKPVHSGGDFEDFRRDVQEGLGGLPEKRLEASRDACSSLRGTQKGIWPTRVVKFAIRADTAQGQAAASQRHPPCNPRLPLC